MKKVYEIDSNGLYVTDVLLGENDPIPSNCVTIDPPQDGSIHVFKWDATNGKWAEAKSDADLLQVYKDAKLSELQSKRDAATYCTFQSSALGTAKTYAYDQTAKARMNGQLTILLSNTSITSVNWVNEEDGMVAHTRDQFTQVVNDAYNHESTQDYHYIQLEGQVNAVTITTTLADAKTQIDGIVW